MTTQLFGPDASFRWKTLLKCFSNIMRHFQQRNHDTESGCGLGADEVLLDKLTRSGLVPAKVPLTNTLRSCIGSAGGVIHFPLVI